MDGFSHPPPAALQEHVRHRIWGLVLAEGELLGRCPSPRIKSRNDRLTERGL